LSGRIKNIFIIISLGLLVLSDCYAQKPSFFNDVLFETKANYGFVIAHHKTMTHLSTNHFPSFEIAMGKQTSGKKYWEEIYKYPIKGIMFYYSTLGNNEILGNAYAIMPYLNFPWAEGKRCSFNFRFAAGLGYITRPFNRTDNFANNAIGSHINAAINLLFEFRWSPWPRVTFNTGIGISHFSNGALKTPNLGINIPAISAGVSFKPEKAEVQKLKNNVDPFSKKMEFRIIGAFGLSNLNYCDTRMFPSYTLSTYMLKPLSWKRKIGGVFDIFYNTEVKEFLLNSGDTIKNDLAIIRPAVSFVHIYEFSRLSFILQVGCYLYTKYKGDGYIYERIGLQFLISKHLQANLSMKIHIAKADNVEFGFGYRF
jgi:hypothetical protein